MTNVKSTKKTLLMSALSLCLCFVMLIGSTFAWFTDSVTSEGNIITAGNLNVGMYWADGTQAVPTEDAGWTDASTGAIFNYDNWEPGYVEVRHIKIANEGDLDLKYTVNIVANGQVTDLADVIDVYYVDPAIQVADREALANAPKLGTLTEVLAALGETGNGTLTRGTADTITIAFKMQESAGNDYQGKSIGTNFSVQLLATQYASESDSFNNQYDANATYPNVSPRFIIPAEGVSEPVTLNVNGVNVEVPAAVVNELPESITSLTLVFAEPIAENEDILYTYVEVIDQDGNKVNLDNNTTPIEVKIYVGDNFAAGDRVKVYHDGEEVAAVNVDENGFVTYEALHFCEVVIAPSDEPTAVVVSNVAEFISALESAEPGMIIDATGVSLDINSVGEGFPNGKIGLSIPGGITIIGLSTVGSYRGGNYLMFEGSADQATVFENCTFEPSGRAMGVGFGSYAGGATSIVYNNCTFKGPVILEFANNPDGVATYNNCTFTKATSGNNYVMAYGGTHLFNNCTFDYTGVTQSNMGIINAASINASSESDGSNSTVVILEGCTRINCGTRKYGANSTLTIR